MTNERIDADEVNSEREAQGWREAALYTVDAESQDDFMTGWRTADRLRRSDVPEPSAERLMQAPAIQAVREVLDQVSDRMDEHAYSEISSVLDDIPDCESATATLHGEHSEQQGEPSDALGLDYLESVAKAATPGPWTSFDEDGEAYSCPPATGAFLVEYGADADQKMRDIRYIAAVDPQTVLALVSAARAARSAGDHADALRVVNDLSLAAHGANSRSDDADFLRGHIEHAVPVIRAALRAAQEAR